MDKARQETRIETWDRLVRGRIAKPLCPEKLRTLLVIVPAASGDVALATTMIRYVKQVNPDCHVTFATEKSNIPLIKMCPGVDETLEVPHVPRDMLSGRESLRHYAGYADAVVYTNWWPEDVDLLAVHGFNMLDTIWMLAGVTGGMPPGPKRVWLEAPETASEAPAVIGRCLSRQTRISIANQGACQFRDFLGTVTKARSFKGTGVISAARGLYALSKNLSELSKPIHRKRLQDASFTHSFVILCTESRSIPPPPRGVIKALVKMLQRGGRTILHNVLDPLHAEPGTIPLVCSYKEFVGLRQAGIPFVGWRSGLCDIAAVSRAPMCVFSPPESAWCRDVQAAFGFNAMGIDADCLEVVCRGVKDVKASNFVAHLDAKGD